MATKKNNPYAILRNTTVNTSGSNNSFISNGRNNNDGNSNNVSNSIINNEEEIEKQKNKNKIQFNSNGNALLNTPDYKNLIHHTYGYNKKKLLKIINESNKEKDIMYDKKNLSTIKNTLLYYNLINLEKYNKLSVEQKKYYEKYLDYIPLPLKVLKIKDKKNFNINNEKIKDINKKIFYIDDYIPKDENGNAKSGICPKFASLEKYSNDKYKNIRELKFDITDCESVNKTVLLQTEKNFLITDLIINNIIENLLNVLEINQEDKDIFIDKFKTTIDYNLNTQLIKKKMNVNKVY